MLPSAQFLRLAPPWLADLYGRALAVHVADFKNYEGEREAAARLPQANAITSETVAGHAVMIDLDVPAALVPSSTPGHSHLYINKRLSLDDLLKVLEVLAEVGIVEESYVAFTEKRKHATLRLPWIRKGREKEDSMKGGHMSSELLNWLHAQPGRRQLVDLPF